MLPDFLVDYFEIVSVNSEEHLHLYFEEKQNLQRVLIELVSKGFLDEITFKIFL
jgi:hypothetical protein